MNNQIITVVLSLYAGLILAILYTELRTIKRGMKCKHVCTICKYKKQCFEDMKGENGEKTDRTKRKR